MKHLATLLLSLFAIGAQPVEAQSRFNGPATFSESAMGSLMIIHLSAWGMACEAKKVNCAAFVMPHVGYSLLMDKYGQYRPGELVIEVDIRLIGQPLAVLVIVHEMTHYLQWVTGQKNVNDMKRYLSPCDAEREAYELSWKVNAKYQIVDPNAETRFLSWEEARPSYLACALLPPAHR